MDDMEWDEALDDVEQEKDLINVCRFYKIPYEKHQVGKHVVYTLKTPKGLKVADEGFTLHNAKEWIYDISNSPYIIDYVSIADKNKEFWEDPPILYHGTYPERVNGIMKRGLEPRDESRGIDNKYTGAAIFASENIEMSQNAYPTVIEINTPQMKNDGYMPEVGIERPVEDSLYAGALAWSIGINDFETDIEQGIFEDTILFRTIIPTKYLRVLEPQYTQITR